MEVDDGKFFGLCKCCLQDGTFRYLWNEFLDENGRVQNYGEMLNECFSLQWQKPDNFLEQICDDCSKRTADAFSFRQLVLTSQEQLKVYTEQPTEDSEVLDTESGEIIIIVKEEGVLSESEVIKENQEVEFFEVDDKDLKVIGAEVELGAQEVEESIWCPKVKKRSTTYKNYTSKDLKQSLEAAKSGKMSLSAAAAMYNVPRKTVAGRLFNTNIKRVSKGGRDFDLIKEIKTLLTYTNMTPYKTRSAQYTCAYCSTDGPLFEDPEDLRTHTRTKHAGDRTKAVERFMRPFSRNEILRVDIDNLRCTFCCMSLVSWNDMFTHLKEQHNLDFDEAFARVIPYLLKNEHSCALCKESFTNYNLLDYHMNVHYNNYICSECGVTFIAERRLRKHLLTHETGRFICNECGKVFNSDNDKKKHVKLAHKQAPKIQCLYCTDKFPGAYQRHLHVLERHREELKSFTCKLCNKSYDWKPHFLAHVRRKHYNERNYKCNFCTRKFFMKDDLNRHEEIHVR